MEANKLFSKLNIRDYNNELEKILDNKLFSVDVKNILLSMLYKIENGYKDYQTIKREVLPKKDLIRDLLDIIKNKCFEIEFLKLDDENKEDQFEVQIDKENGKIKCYPNEKSLLSAIWYMGEEKIEFEPLYDYTKEAIQEMAYVGENISRTEVIRDFNGWSWDIVTKEIESIPYNIIYQTLLLMYGKEIDYKFQKSLYEFTMKIYLKKHEEKQEEIIRINEEKQEQLKLFENKKQFVQTVTEDKKKYNEQIEKIDKMINNTALLKEEYTRRNANLPNKEKIFSISHLAERLEKERVELLEQIRKCNQMIDPKGFVKEKGKLETETDFLEKVLHKEDDKDIECEKEIVNFCNEFLKKIVKKISLIEDKNELINWIYKIRYYAFIPCSQDKSLKDMKGLQENFKRVEKQIIKKAQELKIWDIFTEDKELSYEVLKEIFNSKMINLENINIACQYKDEVLFVKYYDGNILEKEFEIKVKSVRIKRKIKLFI